MLCVTYFILGLQVLKKIGRYIKDQNEKIYAPRGLMLTDPIERGLRVVSFPRRSNPLPSTEIIIFV